MWPMFLLVSALQFAASTIKNPNSPNAKRLEAVMGALYDQMIVTYPHFKNRPPLF